MAYCTHNLCFKEPHSAHLHSRPWPDVSGNELWTDAHGALPGTSLYLVIIAPEVGTLTCLGSQCNKQDGMNAYPPLLLHFCFCLLKAHFY